jgi:AsmA-like protein
MSDTLTEPIARQDAAPPVGPPSRAWASSIKRVVLLLVVLWIASEAASLAVQHTGLHRILTARLQSAFGRPVDVGSYEFSLWHGLALEANSVVVREDPRFGQEYFLRADSMAVRLRWSSLLRGRVEFGTLSLDHPSLNLVRNGVGDWNLTEWLPQPGAGPASSVPVGPAFPSSALRFRRVEVSGGRINFKNGDDKLPFAFINVQGIVETDRPGRWRVNLQATPWRAAVIMQQAGTMRFSGDLGGTSSRLRPAVLDVSWTDASISDVLRLATGNDDGVRGAFALTLDARTADAGDAWTFQTRAQLSQIHRSDLARRPDNPSLNLDARMSWSPSAPSVEISQASLDAPHSHAQATGAVDWARPPQLGKRPGGTGPARVLFSDADVDMRDVLAWVSAFHPGMAAGLDVRGFARAHAELSDWPPGLTSAVIATDGIDLSAPALGRPAQLGELRLRYDHGSASLGPATLSFGAPDNALHFESLAKPGRPGLNGWHISANVVDVHEVLAAAAAMGWNLSKGWDVVGPVRADLRWPGSAYPWKTAPVGFINWGAGPGVATLRVSFLNQPIAGINAVSEWKPGSRHIALASAEAFGAHWSGSFDRPFDGMEPAGEWQFSLNADHLSAADLDRWLNPAWRESFIDRVLPFLASRPPAAAPGSLKASGHLSLDQFTLSRLGVRKLEGDLKIDGRHVTLANASGQFYGGQVGGTLTADLTTTPAYRAHLGFTRVDAAALIAATPSLSGLTAKFAGGEISLSASGANHESLVGSLTCQGSATASDLALSNLARWDSPEVNSSVEAPRKFLTASASFTCAQRTVEFQTLTLMSSVDLALVGAGKIDFSRNLDLALQSRYLFPPGEDDRVNRFTLTGTLVAPQVRSIPAAAQRSR